MLGTFQHTPLLSVFKFYQEKIHSSQNRICVRPCPQISSRNKIRVRLCP